MAELADTCLFPEGGGQPSDHGWMVVDGVSHPVKHVARNAQNGLIDHHVLINIAEGTRVKVVVDWERRWDHMVQHSAVRLSPSSLFVHNIITCTHSHTQAHTHTRTHTHTFASSLH